MDTRTYLRAILGDEAGDKAADAMGRTLDEAVFYGTHAPIQENEMNEQQITEVSATVDAGLSQEDVDGLGEAERLGLIVGAAYGQALAERDEARSVIESQAQRLASAHVLLNEAVALWPETSWAEDSHAKARLVQGIESLWPVDSEQTPTQED